ncbi:MAG TPA: surface-adhesin E family protein [Gemmatimonadaceae bacterium]
MRLSIVTTLALVAALPVAAHAQWREIGKTSAGNPVSVDAKSIKTKDGITSARLQVKFVEPVQTPQGVWRLSRHDAMFNCAKKTIAAKASTYYSDVAATKVVKHDVIKIPGYGPAIGGSMTQVAMDYICKGK